MPASSASDTPIVSALGFTLIWYSHLPGRESSSMSITPGYWASHSLHFSTAPSSCRTASGSAADSSLNSIVLPPGPMLSVPKISDSLPVKSPANCRHSLMNCSLVTSRNSPSTSSTATAPTWLPLIRALGPISPWAATCPTARCTSSMIGSPAGDSLRVTSKAARSSLPVASSVTLAGVPSGNTTFASSRFASILGNSWKGVMPLRTMPSAASRMQPANASTDSRLSRASSSVGA